MTLEGLLSELEPLKKVILSDHHRSLTGSEFVAEIRNSAAELKSLGIGKHKPILLCMNNTVECVTALFSSLLCEGVVFIVNPFDPIDRLYKTIKAFAPFFLLSRPATAKAIQAHCALDLSCELQHLRTNSLEACRFAANDIPLENYDLRTRGADLAIFSSGSTGEPKAILHRIGNVMLNAKLHAVSIGLRETDIIGGILPLYYSYGLVANLLASLITKSHIVLHKKVATIDVHWVHDKQISVLGLTPYFAQKHLTIPPQSLRILTLGGDVLYSKHAKAIMCNLHGCDLFATYGLTEAGPRVATWRFDDQVLEGASIAPLGQPLEGIDLAICETNGKDTRYGELVVDTPTRMLGYFFGVSTGYMMPDWPLGKVYTGDLFECVNADLFFVGRKKQIIVLRGEKIVPLAIESVIQNIEGVVDVLVDSIPDENEGHIVKVFIQAKDSLTSRAVRKALQRHFPYSLIPEDLEFVDSIPRSPTGKRSKMDLKKFL